MELKFKARDPLTVDYLRYLFKSPADGAIRISLSNDFGRMVVGMFKTSDRPVESPEGPNVVTLRLPSHWTTQAARTKYAYLTETDMQRLNMILLALFNIEIDTYYIKGIQAGMAKCDIINAFIVSRRLVTLDYTDTLNKRIYRSTLSSLKEKAELIHRKARYHFSQIAPPSPRKK